MVDKISFAEFSAADGVEDWRALGLGVATQFQTGSFAKGVELTAAIGRLADAANHHPDVDLRYPTVTVRMFTHEADGLTQRDVDLARKISAAARELGAAADPEAVPDA
jgi:4a-hydroxytetrahydrobiopterin dehydratase